MISTASNASKAQSIPKRYGHPHVGDGHVFFISSKYGKKFLYSFRWIFLTWTSQNQKGFFDLLAKTTRKSEIRI